MPHILFAASGSDSVWHPTACQGGLIPYWFLALTGFPFARLSFSCLDSDSAYWSRPVLVAGAAEREIKMESARQYPWKISISRP